LQCDNASNNDTCIQDLAKEFDFDFKERRLRCIEHIINLVARSIIFGLDPNAFEAFLSVATDDVHD
jgi:hypothetical protein